MGLQPYFPMNWSIRQSIDWYIGRPSLPPRACFSFSQRKNMQFLEHAHSPFVWFSANQDWANNSESLQNNQKVLESQTSVIGSGQSSCSRCWPNDKQALGTRLGEALWPNPHFMRFLDISSHSFHFCQLFCMTTYFLIDRIMWPFSKQGLLVKLEWSSDGVRYKIKEVGNESLRGSQW